MKSETIAEMPEIIRALTPIFLAAIGGAIGISVLTSNAIGSDATKLAAGIGLAGTAITGAAGLAQSAKSEPRSTNTDTAIPSTTGTTDTARL